MENNTEFGDACPTCGEVPNLPCPTCGHWPHEPCLGTSYQDLRQLGVSAPAAAAARMTESVCRALFLPVGLLGLVGFLGLIDEWW